MFDFIQKTFFKVKRLGNELSEEEKLIAMMIPFAETTERDLLGRIEQAEPKHSLSHAALTVQAECRLKDRTESGISDAQEEHLRRLNSIAQNSAEDREALYQALCYLGHNLDKRHNYYYAKVLHKGKVRDKHLIQIRHLIRSNIKSELDLRRLVEEGFGFAGKEKCRICSADAYHVYSPDRIDHSDYEEIDHIDNDETLCAGHNVVVKDGKIALSTLREEATTFL